MTTITHDGGELLTGTTRRSPIGKLLLGGLVAWSFIGPFAGILYEHRVNTWDGYRVAALPHEDILASYFANALFNYLGGAAIWFVGMAALGLLAWWSRPGASGDGRPDVGI